MMRWLVFVGIGFALFAAGLAAGDHGHSCGGDPGGCEPRCRGTWHDEKKKPVYDIRCEYACARGRDSWHAPDPECRCRPPCGQVYVKKKLYKSEGEERVERVPRYDVTMVPAERCGCASCRGGGSGCWDPLGILSFLQRW
jgi:hypothetical protein